MDRDYRKVSSMHGRYMNEAEGVVKDIRGSNALVLTDRQAMCGTCEAKGFCRMLGGGKEILSEALNPIGAGIGDMVKIGIPAGAVTKASMVVYLLPAVGIVGGAVIGYFLGMIYNFDANVSTLIGGAVCLGLSMLLVRQLNNILSRSPSYQPEIIKIINPDACKRDNKEQ